MIQMKYPMDAERVLSASESAYGPLAIPAQKMIMAAISLANKAYEDGFMAGLAASERMAKDADAH